MPKSSEAKLEFFLSQILYLNFQSIAPPHSNETSVKEFQILSEFSQTIFFYSKEQNNSMEIVNASDRSLFFLFIYDARLQVVYRVIDINPLT